MNTFVLSAFYLLCKKILCEGLSNNLALTPPMGWTTWGRFRCNTDCDNYPDECIRNESPMLRDSYWALSEWLLRHMAEKMVSEGYLSAGYNYVLLDDCWLASKRDSSGRLQPDHKRFPSGIKNLSDFIHSLGFNFGIYENYGRKTCEGYPGILPETVRIDVETFVQWGIDYVKLDGCYSEPINMVNGFNNFGHRLLCSKRPIVYSCSWPFYQLNIGMSVNYTAAATMCNLWRVYKDIQDSWKSVESIINYFGDHQEILAPVSGPGRWNDPDMLIIGNYGLSFEQARVQMVVWAILAAPLIMSNDLRKMHPEFKEILQNPLLIELNQDPLGIQGRRIYRDRYNKYEVWTRPVVPIKDNKFSWAIAIINTNDDGEPNAIAFPLKYSQFWQDLRFYDFVDMFDVHSIVEMNCRGELLSRVPPTGVKLYKAIAKDENQARPGNLIIK